MCQFCSGNGVFQANIHSYLVAYFLAVYHARPHTTTGEPPATRWQKAGFEPRMPISLRQMDLLLTMSQSRKVLRDGLHLNGLIYWANELAGLIEESVLIRFDPQNVAYVVVYHKSRYLCTAVVSELIGLKISLKEWHTLQAQQRQSARTIISIYREYIQHERNPQIPLSIPAQQVDMMIMLERLVSTSHQDELALFPSDLEKPLLLLEGHYD